MERKLITELSTHLFWDVSIDGVDTTDNKSFLIKRVLEYGTWRDWKLILDFYGMDEIVSVAKKFRELDPRSLSFLANLSSTPVNQFWCYNTRQSAPPHLNF